MPARLTMTMLDHDAEVSSVGFEGVTITAANLEAQYLLQDAIVAAVKDISLAAHTQTQRLGSYGWITRTPPVDVNAQRERKWLVQLLDNVTLDRLSLEVPCADLSLLDAAATGQMDETSDEYLALKAAIEAYVKSPKGNPVVVGHVVHVGRNI